MVKKLLVFLGLAGASAAYALTRDASVPTTTQATPTPALAPVVHNQNVVRGDDEEDDRRITQNPAPTPVQATPRMMGGTMSPVGSMMNRYTDGTYTGSVADAFYGLVQVQASVSGGKLTDVTFLQYPSDRSTSRFINSQAMPMLTQEAIVAQSADVSGVSGATETSGAFRTSLAVALAAAKN